MCYKMILEVTDPTSAGSVFMGNTIAITMFLCIAVLIFAILRKVLSKKIPDQKRTKIYVLLGIGSFGLAMFLMMILASVLANK